MSECTSQNKMNNEIWLKNTVIETLVVCLDYTYLFYNQPVYKQLALELQIAKQLSGHNLFSLRNNKKYRSKKREVFILH